jgi:CRP-like cAMP-binding protein
MHMSKGLDLTAVLAHAPYFQELDASHITSLAQACIARHVKRKEIIFAEGDEGHSIYLLVHGNIQLSKAAPDGSERVIKIVQPGEMFAEVILFERNTYPVTATALRESTLMLVPKKAFHQLLGEEAFRNDFIATLLRKQRYLTEKILSLTTHDAEERFFRFLHEQYGDSKTITLSISKKDIAAAIGVTPETLSRLVQKLAEAKKLRWEGHTLELFS